MENSLSVEKFEFIIIFKMFNLANKIVHNLRHKNSTNSFRLYVHLI